MSQSISQRRPWLAALLAALVTGLGHLYLRRWRRAFVWLIVLFAVTVLFVDPATVDAIAAGNAVDPAAMAPILVVVGLSVFDAYVLARAHNAVARVTVTADGKLSHCPNCGRELDADLEFCHWCSTEVKRLDVAPPTDEDDRDT